MKGERFLAYAAFVTVCILWGTTYLAIRIAIETLPVFLFPGVRFTIAGAILLSICLLRGQKLPPRTSDWLNIGLIGFLLVGVGNGAVVWAEQHVDSGLTALLVATSPLWMAIIESFRKNGERVTRRKAIGMAIGFAGVVLLVARGITLSKIDVGFVTGVLVLQLGSIAWNIGSVRSKYHPIQATPLVSAALQMLLGGVMLSIFGLAHGDAAHFRFNPRTLAAFIYLAIFGSIVAYGAYVYALSKLRTSTVSLYAYVNPVVAVFLGWLILKEPLTLRSVLAMCVIFAGVALVQSSRGRQKKLASSSDDAPAEAAA